MPTAGQMFHATGGQHSNSDEFFQAREHSERLDEGKKFLEVRENRLLLQQTEKKACGSLAAKVPLNEETFEKCNEPDIKISCEWKGIEVKADKKEETFALCNSAPVQHPNLPTIGYTWSILMRDSQGRDSFTKDTLLSASD